MQPPGTHAYWTALCRRALPGQAPRRCLGWSLVVLCFALAMHSAGGLSGPRGLAVPLGTEYEYNDMNGSQYSSRSSRVVGKVSCTQVIRETWRGRWPYCGSRLRCHSAERARELTGVLKAHSTNDRRNNRTFDVTSHFASKIKPLGGTAFPFESEQKDQVGKLALKLIVEECLGIRGKAAAARA